MSSRIYLSSNINQYFKKRHLIHNVLRISDVIDGVIPEGMNRSFYARNILGSMSEEDLININCELLSRITPDIEIKKLIGKYTGSDGYKIKYTDGTFSGVLSRASAYRHKKKFKNIESIIKLSDYEKRLLPRGYYFESPEER